MAPPKGVPTKGAPAKGDRKGPPKGVRTKGAPAKGRRNAPPKGQGNPSQKSTGPKKPQAPPRLPKGVSDAEAGIYKPGAYAGFDRPSPPQPNQEEKGEKGKTKEEFLLELYIHSNLDFAGAYLAGSLPDGTKETEYTNSSFEEHRTLWTGLPKNAKGTPKYKGVLKDLLGQGWGIVFFYVGYSVGGGQKAPEAFYQDKGKELAKTRGKLHAEHIKIIVSACGREFEGCTVMVDNEDSDDVTGKKASKENARKWESVRTYYNAMFEEMRKPGPGTCGPVRPGFYAQPEEAADMLKESPDLFVWIVRYGKRDIKKTDPVPFEQRTRAGRPPDIRLEQLKDRHTAPPKWHQCQHSGDLAPPDILDEPDTENITLPTRGMLDGPDGIRLAAVKVPGSRTGLPLGGQLIRYLGQDMPTKTLKKTKGKRCVWDDILIPANNWDFDFSLVRDPIYPVAGPRFCIEAPSKICGFFIKETTSMKVLVRDEGGLREIPAPAGGREKIAPEAPLIPLNATEVLSLNSSGHMVISTASGSPLTWTPFQPLPDPSTQPLPLRRNRAVTATTHDREDIQVFYLSTAHTIVGRRRLARNWGDAFTFAAGEHAHSFSTIASTHRGTESVDVFYIDTDGFLHTAWWTYGSLDSDGWPSKTHHRLPDNWPNGSKPRLLPSTAIAAVSPRPSDILVFAIGWDTRLYMYVFESSGWITQPVALGEEEAFVFAHSRIAVLATKPNTVRIAAITDQGIPCVYGVVHSGTNWATIRARILLDHTVFPLPRFYGPPTPNAPVEADTFDVNPYGDISLTLFDGHLTIFVAGVRGGETGLLWKRVDAVSEPWRREPDFHGH